MEPKETIGIPFNSLVVGDAKTFAPHLAHQLALVYEVEVECLVICCRTCSDPPNDYLMVGAIDDPVLIQRLEAHQGHPFPRVLLFGNDDRMC